jgi:hypothetical protein
MSKTINLDECILITSAEYYELPGTPKFIGQTRLDDDNMYYMVFESEGVIYKTHNKL